MNEKTAEQALALATNQVSGLFFRLPFRFVASIGISPGWPFFCASAGSARVSRSLSSLCPSFFPVNGTT